MITLVELGAIFWVGALLLLNFVLLRTSETQNEALQQQREIALRRPIVFFHWQTCCSA